MRYPGKLANLICLSQNDITSVWPRHAAVDQNQVVFFVDPYELDITNRDPLVAVAAGHALALLHAAATAVSRQRAGATHMTVHLLHTVRRSLAAEIVPLHGTRKAAAFRLARNI